MLKTKMTVAFVGVVMFAASGLAFGEDENKDGEAAKPKHTIKEVMKVGLKGKESLNAKVLGGDATDKEKLELLDLYVSLLENKPPKGEMDSWQKMAGGAALAAAKVVVGREDALKDLKAATNCAKCHKAHKPPSE